MTHETGKLKVTLLSPLHLASGAADVNVDADVVHDTLGLPYFPARRLRGLLYESALEVVEMGEAAGTTQFATRAAVEALFHHDGGEVALVVDDLHLPDYEQVAADWRAILDAYAGVVRPADVLAAYTGLRMQTALDDGGRADDATLRTIRVLLPRAGDGKSLAFTGDITIQNGTAEHWQALAWACQNLRRAGGHRWRGFGSVHCELTPPRASRAARRHNSRRRHVPLPRQPKRPSRPSSSPGSSRACRASRRARRKGGERDGYLFASQNRDTGSSYPDREPQQSADSHGQGIQRRRPARYHGPAVAGPAGAQRGQR